MASYQRTLRSRRPHARGDVLCTEPGRSHHRPKGIQAGRSKTQVVGAT